MALTVAAAPAAMADESAMPTTQARAYNADWVPYLDPPEKPAAVCLVDSGVNVTPDTPADSPDGPIVKRLALDGGPGTAAGSTWEDQHGTRMAFVGAAPVNGWGAVGFWPGARIVSIRAMPMGATVFSFDDYARAIDLCTKNASALNVVAVNLALACDCEPNEDERRFLDTRIVAAHANGLSVVAAAGNSSGPIGNPARAAGVLAVGAGNSERALCAFSNRGSDLDLVAPGCDLELADPASGQLWSGYASGTSGASMTVSIALALLRSYRPDIDWREAEELISSVGPGSGDGPVLDIEAVFRRAGLGTLVDAAKERAPVPRRDAVTPSVPSTYGITNDVAYDLSTIDPSTTAPPLEDLAAPRTATVRRHGRLLTIVVRNRPLGGRLIALLQRRVGEFRYATVAHTAHSSSRITLRLPRRWRGGKLVLRYEVRKQPRHTSSAVECAVPR